MDSSMQKVWSIYVAYMRDGHSAMPEDAAG